MILFYRTGIGDVDNLKHLEKIWKPLYLDHARMTQSVQPVKWYAKLKETVWNTVYDPTYSRVSKVIHNAFLN